MRTDQDTTEEEKSAENCNICNKAIADGEGRYHLPSQEKVICCQCMENLKEIKQELQQATYKFFKKAESYNSPSEKID